MAGRIVWALCLFPLTLFSVEEWIPLCLEETIHSFRCEQHREEISFEMSIPIYVACSYPTLSGKGTLIEYVNKQLKAEAEDRFSCSVRDEIFTEDIYEDGSILDYELLPVYQASHLISIYGFNFQGRGTHGCTYYEGKTFWQKGDSVVKLALDDLFIKGSDYRHFLLHYCENYFKASGYGYYSSRDELLPELDLSDLETFVVTDKGLMIIFRAYLVGGWADGPDTVLIPYSKLKAFIDPLGPLKEMIK